MTTKTLYLFFNCCMEASRANVARKVIQNLKEQQHTNHINIEQDMIAFDNGSSYEDSSTIIDSLNCVKVYAKHNLGYWSAINWVFINLERLVKKKYEYVYIIESDHTHYALQKISDCESALNLYPELGGIRLQEYSVKDQHLYNKTQQHPEGRSYAWVSHINIATGKPVKLFLVDEHLGIYESNFLTCLHSINRLHTMREIFINLSQLEQFSEHDFQKLYHHHYELIGQHDGGIFHAKLGCTLDDSSIVSGSWSTNLTQIGYKETRHDKILQYSDSDIRIVQ